MKRVYKNHGQITIVERVKGWNNFIIDCGCYWLKHSIDDNYYMEGSYDSKGYFTSLRYITRELFITNMKRCLKNLKRVIT